MPLQPPPAVILAANEWVQAIPPILVALFVGLRMYLEARSEASKQKLRRAGRAAKEGLADDGEPMAANAAGGDTPATSVDDFLRQLANDQGADTPADRPEKARQPAVQAETRRARRTERSPGRADAESKTKQRRPKPRQRPAATTSSVGDHVREHMGHLEESQLAEQAALLGAGVASRDDRISEGVESKFDHQLGKLDQHLGVGPGPVEAAAAEAGAEQPPAAERVAKLLANPSSIREAIILNEILQRPTDRW
ncbi:MAG: hypothetical protein AAGB00_10010 [Planctomycetota bacterium]